MTIYNIFYLFLCPFFIPSLSLAPSSWFFLCFLLIYALGLVSRSYQNLNKVVLVSIISISSLQSLSPTQPSAWHGHFSYYSSIQLYAWSYTGECKVHGIWMYIKIYCLCKILMAYHFHFWTQTHYYYYFLLLGILKQCFLVSMVSPRNHISFCSRHIGHKQIKSIK